MADKPTPNKDDKLNVTALENQISSADTAAPNAAKPGEERKESPTAQDMPASRAAQKAGAAQSRATAKQKPQSGFAEKVWKPILWPIVTLVAICLVTSFLLSLTNNITVELIAQNATKAADEARAQLLPEADGFEEMAGLSLPDNITSMYKATNDAGYVIEAFSQGYGGRVPALVAFNAEGNIAGVQFLENSETPGLGQNLVAKPEFAQQFAGKPSERINQVEALTAATISSNAARDAVNAAIEFYNAEVKGEETAAELTPEEVRAMLLPDATSITAVEVDIDNVTEAYVGDDGNFIIYATAPGFHRDSPKDVVTAAVAIDPAGTVLAVWLDTTRESEGYGAEISKNQEFLDSFVGKTAADAASVDAVATTTVTSEAAKTAVQTALEALPAVQQAAGSTAPTGGASPPAAAAPAATPPANKEAA